MRRRNRQCRRGSAVIEFVLTGVPMIFIWISVVQMSLGMWHYHTLQYATKGAAMYIAHHGTGCSATGNTCANQLKDAALVMKALAIGIPASSITVTWTPYKNGVAGTAVTCTLDSCITDTRTWPPSTYDVPGTSDTKIVADYLFQSALCMVAPGPGAGPVRFGQFHLPGSAYQQILF